MGVTSTIPIVTGDVASGATDTSNPVKFGGRAGTATPTSVSDGQRVNAWLDKSGKQVVTEIPRELQLGGQVSLTTTTSTAVIAAQASGVRIAVSHIHVSNGGSSMVRVDILDGATVKWSTYAAPNGGGAGEDFDVPAFTGTAATAVNAQLSGAPGANDVRVMVAGYQEV